MTTVTLFVWGIDAIKYNSSTLLIIKPILTKIYFVLLSAGDHVFISNIDIIFRHKCFTKNTVYNKLDGEFLIKLSSTYKD